AASDLAGEAPLLRLHRQRRPRGVDDRDQRQAQLVGQPHAPARLAQRRRAHRGQLALLAPVLAEQDARRLAEPGEREQQTWFTLALAGAVEGDHVVGRVPQEPSYPGPLGAT